jgi:hypothetical protein
MREQMPQTAALIDAFRHEFGVAGVNESIRRGMKGEATFWARENGHEVGTRDQRPGVTVALQQPVIIGKPKHDR